MLLLSIFPPIGDVFTSVGRLVFLESGAKVALALELFCLLWGLATLIISEMTTKLMWFQFISAILLNVLNSIGVILICCWLKYQQRRGIDFAVMITFTNISVTFISNAYSLASLLVQEISLVLALVFLVSIKGQIDVNEELEDAVQGEYLRSLENTLNSQGLQQYVNPKLQESVGRLGRFLRLQDIRNLYHHKLVRPKVFHLLCACITTLYLGNFVFFFVESISQSSNPVFSTDELLVWNSPKLNGVHDYYGRKYPPGRKRVVLVVLDGNNILNLNLNPPP